MTDPIYNVLFLCTGNSARSILAESILRKDGHGRFRAFSAGSTPNGTVNPLAIQTLKSFGYPTDGLRSKTWLEFSQPDVPEQRIAVFDNDGTLWTEQPYYFQLAFAFDQVKALAPKHPEWKGKQPFKDIIEGDLKSALSAGMKGLEQILAVTHAGMTTDEFAKSVSAWTQTARHPRFHRPYTELVYQPMLELLSYLRANGFKTFIVSGGGVEFMRPWMEKAYGIPPEQIVGSSGAVKFIMGKDGRPQLMKTAKVEFVDDGPGKPVGINRFIGRKPIFAFGNSDGDLQMLQWTMAGDGPHFAGLVHHTDGEREYAYDRHSHIGKLDKALDEATAKNWTVVDMKKDWKTVFPSGH